MYIAVKTKYQLGELPATSLILGMKDLCKEIEEFIHTLYNNTELPEERDSLTQLTQKLSEAFKDVATS